MPKIIFLLETSSTRYRENARCHYRVYPISLFLFPKPLLFQLDVLFKNRDFAISRSRVFSFCHSRVLAFSLFQSTRILCVAK